MAKAKPVHTTHKAAGFVAARKVKEPRVVWKDLEARGAKGVAYAQLAAGDRIVGLVGKGDYELVFADGTGVHATKLAKGPWKGLALRDDGGAVLVFSKSSLAEVDLSSGEARALEVRFDGALEGACYAKSDVALLVHHDEWELLLARRDGGRLDPIARVAIGAFVFGVGGRAGVVVVATDEKETSRVFVARDGTLVDAGRIKPPVNTVQTCGEQLLVTGVPGVFEIDLHDVLR